MTRKTYLERRWPDTPTFQNIAVLWCEDQSHRLLDLVWRGYELLMANDLQQVAFNANDEAREESLNYLLSLRIDQCKGIAPFNVAHNPPEQTKRKRGKGKSPEPDIGFALYEHPRTVWPIEAKVLMHDSDVTPYVNEIKTNFIEARYATFSSEGAMVGYLLAGDAATVLSHISVALRCTLRKHAHFDKRPHMLSDHKRANLPHQNSPANFVCHHLIFCLS